MVQHSESDGWDQAYRHLQHAEGLPFSELLPPERVARSAAALQIKYRARVFMPITVLWTFLSQVLSPDHSCREAVARFLAWRLVQGQEPCSTDTSSYCEARQRLPKELVQQLVRDTGCESAQAAKANWLWKGRHVKIVDGTTVILPDTAANQAAYPQPRSQRPGVGFPMARVVVVFSLACGAILDAAMGPMLGKKTGENALFRQLLSILQPNDVLLADRFYASFQEFARARARGADIVARQHQSRATDFRRGHWLGRLDHRVVWHRPQFDSQRFDRATWEALPRQLEVRELRYYVTQPGFRSREITLATTLLDAAAYPADEISGLYRERWNCELNLRSLKTFMQMGRLRCRTPEMAEKETWTHFLAYNLIRETMATAARTHGVRPQSLSFKGTVQIVNAFTTYLPFLRSEREAIWQEMLLAIATHQVGDRPNRIEPRKLKYRVGKYPYMTNPRNEERQRLCA